MHCEVEVMYESVREVDNYHEGDHHFSASSTTIVGLATPTSMLYQDRDALWFRCAFEQRPLYSGRVGSLQCIFLSAAQGPSW